jgi:hypothetical protein
MSNRKEWMRPVEKVETFPKLREISLCDCDKLTRDFPWLLQSLTKLSISRKFAACFFTPKDASYE